MKTFPLSISQNSRSVVSAESSNVVYFDYQRALSLRAAALRSGMEVPVYLLVPEVVQLLYYLPDLHQQMLFATLWNTGARLNEALALTPASLVLDGDLPFVVLKTLKQRQRSKGRPRKDEETRRAVPLTDPLYVRRMTEYLATTRCGRNEPVWSIHDNTVRNWLNAAIARAESDGVTFSVTPITPHTFRHSYCMNLIQHGVPLKVVQAYAGHARLTSTEVYTKIFALDVGRQYDVRFSLPDAGFYLQDSE